MKNLFRLALSSALLLGIPIAAVADRYEPSHMCRKPHKPYQFTSQWEVDRFNDDIQRFKRCITDFVEEQTAAADNHSNAIETAIDDWNRFVRIELN